MLAWRYVAFAAALKTGKEGRYVTEGECAVRRFFLPLRQSESDTLGVARQATAS